MTFQDQYIMRPVNTTTTITTTTVIKMTKTIFRQHMQPHASTSDAFDRICKPTSTFYCSTGPYISVAILTNSAAHFVKFREIPWHYYPQIPYIKWPVGVIIHSVRIKKEPIVF